MKKAWQDPIGTIRDVCPGDPAESYHPDVAAFYTTDVPDDAVNGATLVEGVWTNPPPPPEPEPAPPPAPEPPVWHITKLAFRNRFTQAEKVTLEIASLDNPAASMAQRQQAAALRVNLADTASATYIDLSRTDTRAGVQMLEAAGLLGAGRALEILDTEITDAERYRA